MSTSSDRANVFDDDANYLVEVETTNVKESSSVVNDSDDRADSIVGVGSLSPIKNRKSKRANVNWSNKAELELIQLIQHHKAHLKRVTGETQEEKWQNISKKLSQSSHFNGQQLTTGQVQMKWNRLTKRIQDRYSVDIDGSSVCKMPDDPDEITKGVFDILCEAEAKNTDKAIFPIQKDNNKKIPVLNIAEECADNSIQDISRQSLEASPPLPQLIKLDESPRAESMCFRVTLVIAL